MSGRSITDLLAEHTGEKRPSAATARKAARELRGWADRLGDAGGARQHRADAKRLDEYASGLDLDAAAKDLGLDEPNTVPEGGDGDKPGSSRPAGDRTRTGRRRPGKPKPAAKRPGKLSRAARQATVDEPIDRTAGAVRSAGSVFWTFALGTVGLVLAYVLLTNSQRAAGLIDGIGRGAERVAYPKTAFPERYAAAQPRAAGRPRPTPRRNP